MNKDDPSVTNQETKFSEQVGAQAARKLKARRSATKNIWFGLGMSGLIGWSVTVPTLLGIALGVWVDSRFPSQYSWTLMFLLMGLMIGCFNTWHWIDSEYQAMQEDSDE